MTEESKPPNPADAETLDTTAPMSGSDPGPLSNQTEIDNYRLIQKVAEGGMGEVYEAEQLRPVRRRVAVKVIKLGMDTRRFVARFEAERQALALMDHSNIARIFDAGATKEGRPYFSMEFVRGVPITEYCDRQRLDTLERLDLFLAVTEGVHHAHQKGIIHRDIKPSNILVAFEGEKAIPKVIDFGLAKATGASLTEPNTFTQFGQAVGTPAYMSPEQITMDASGVDTRTDVYALGVLLYELLAGTLPFDLTGTPTGGFEEIRRRICEEEPSRPSLKVRTLGDTSTEIARRRHTDPAVLVKQLEGDLDWIILKALEKDRNRRYPSVSGLAADIRRFLTDQPVLARPPSATYRIAKFARRHRVGVSAAVLALVALLAGTTLATIGLVRASRAEEEARLEAETANQVTEFLIDLYQVSDPSEARGNSVTARELLDKGAESIRTELTDQPAVRTRLLHQMGRVYQALGLYPEARELLELSLESAETVDDVRLRDSIHNLYTDLARLALSQGRTEEAFEYAGEAVLRGTEALGELDPSVGAATLVLGRIHRSRAEYDDARRLFEQSLAIFEASFGSEHINVAWPLYHLGWLYQLQGEYQAAVPVYESVLSIAEQSLDDDHPDLATFLNDVGVLYSNLGDHVKSEEFHRRALEVREKALEPDHPSVASSLDNVGTELWYQSMYQEARPYYERALEIRRTALGPDHPRVGASLNNLALLLRTSGDLSEARPLYEEALRITELSNGPDHPGTALTSLNLGNLLAYIGDYSAAQSLLERGLGIYEAVHGPYHLEVGNALRYLSDMHMLKGDWTSAVPLLERELEIRESALGSDHVDLAYIFRILGVQHRSVAALERAASIYERNDDIAKGNVLWDLAWLYQRNGDSLMAEELARDAREIVGTARGDSGAAAYAYDMAHSDAVRNINDPVKYKLKQAIELGLSDPALKDEEHFAFLHEDPDFEAMVAELETRSR